MPVRYWAMTAQSRTAVFYKTTKTTFNLNGEDMALLVLWGLRTIILKLKLHQDVQKLLQNRVENPSKA
jgi:hypothetical protein